MRKEELWKNIDKTRSNTPVVFTKHYYDSVLARGITVIDKMHKSMTEVDDEMSNAVKVQGQFYPSEVVEEEEYNKWYCIFQRENLEIIKLPILNKNDRLKKCYVNLVKNIMRISESKRVLFSEAKQKLYNKYEHKHIDTGGEK